MSLPATRLGFPIVYNPHKEFINLDRIDRGLPLWDEYPPGCATALWSVIIAFALVFLITNLVSLTIEAGKLTHLIVGCFLVPSAITLAILKRKLVALYRTLIFLSAIGSSIFAILEFLDAEALSPQNFIGFLSVAVLLQQTFFTRKTDSTSPYNAVEHTS